MTDFLFGNSSAFVGWARLLDLGNNLSRCNASRSDEEADWQALNADWGALGQDMRSAITQVTGELLGDGRD